MTDGGNRLGILGGTFDPPHIGHLLLAETAREELVLNQVLFLPAGHPPHKRRESITPASHRLAMTELATADNDAFVVDAVDVHRPPPHYTVTLLPLLHQAYPDSELWLLIGGDSLRDLPAWHRPHEVINSVRLAVLPRPGAQIDWDALEKAVSGVRDAAVMLDGPSIAVSSTRIRHWAATGRSLRYLIPSPVLTYIAQEGLYRDRR